MTQNIGELRKHMAQRFPDVEQIDESVIRLTRKSHDQAFAVYYIDVASRPPTTLEALNRYQDRVIGSHYFDGRKSLQWSNYLYFVVTEEQLRSKEILNARSLIELDRTYARKYIVTEGDLDLAIQPPTPVPLAQPPQTNVLSVWTEKLAEAGLEAAVMSEASLPSRLNVIEHSATKAAPKLKKSAPQSKFPQSAFLHSLSFIDYRRYPTRRSFAFGTVNLVVSANGTGKTSLLEAIELVYCGRNKRNPDASDNYSIEATFADGTKEMATRARLLQTFRDRNLAWYGQSEIKTSNLYQSFARFNFLDTDAAVGLAESTVDLEEVLSKLLVGPQASKTWREIERIHGAVSARLRELQPLKKQANEELVSIEATLKSASNIKQESESLLISLETMAQRVGWKMPAKDREAFVSQLVVRLSEVGALARQAMTFEWAGSPVSLGGLKQYSDSTKLLSKKAAESLALLDQVRREENRLAESSRRAKEALILADSARSLVEADVPKRAAELLSVQDQAAAQSGVLANYDEQLISSLPAAASDVTLEQLGDAASLSYRCAVERLAGAKAEHDKFTSIRDQSLKLTQELRGIIAAQIINSGSNTEQCPLCHTQFQPGELAEHIQLGVDLQIEERAQTLLAHTRQLEVNVRSSLLAQRATSWLNSFCERAGLPMNTGIKVALGQVDRIKGELAVAVNRSETLTQEFLRLGAKGLSLAKLNEVGEGLRGAGHDVADWSKVVIDRIYLSIKGDQADISKSIDEQRKKASKLHLSLESDLGIARSDVRDINKVVLELRERYVLADSLLMRFERLLIALPWQRDSPLSDLLIEAESIRQVAANLQAALGRERTAKSAFEELHKRKAQLTKRLGEIGPSITRFTEAKRALEGIQKHDSLSAAMESALKINRAGIEDIFGRIHSPAEFAGLGEQLATLVRRGDGAEAALSQISTGQRAAFALSLFLAQNLQLRTAPPILLIDDPIAHVDDLNSLSFLDYLREIVLASGRQIIFATANEKLATLFERKFDFLGDGRFCRFNLRR